MANKLKQSQFQNVVHCDVCGKQILPEQGMAIATDYVWYEGKNYCHDCVVSGKVRKIKSVFDKQ